METLTRVDAREDPYLALRTTLGVGLCLALAEPLGMTQPMLPIAIGMSLLSGQRGALTARSFAGPLMLPVVAIVFSWLAAVTVNEPLVFLFMNVVLAAGGIALMLFRGSRAGMMLTVFPAMMSISALYNEYALAAIRDSMVSGGLLVGAAAVVTNILFPPQTRRIHVDSPKPHVSRNPALELGIRVVVYLATLIATYATNNISLLIAPIMMVFVCAEPDHGGRMEQVVDRGGGTIVGAVVGVAALAVYNLVPEFIVLLTLLMIITFWLIERMTTGPARPQYYQYVCSVALVIVLSSIYGANSAMEVVVQRVTITVGIMLAGIALLSLLEAIFLRRDDSPEDLGPAPSRL
ncbi:Fusaric acid resistance protein-like [Devosia crocina]|uniref:Fusaric acid resistance protein-like n=1 Tax=Devosia crocina TaxID=429728 RepID=A0A1I7NUZ9_9HYPH|nr:FUSC family protein [Devosia crocina]SFV38499.1 Fusaric acid resistance protein-like [Devosia crocina]